MVQGLGFSLASLVRIQVPKTSFLCGPAVSFYSTKPRYRKGVAFSELPA